MLVETTSINERVSVIEVSGLTKTFEKEKRKEGIGGALVRLVRQRKETLYAVRDMSFTIDEGEIVGYIGPNGSGKSTTIKMLTGILTPTAGAIRVFGRDPLRQRKENARDIGVVFGQRTQLWWDLPVKESFGLYKSVYDIPDKTYKENLRIFSNILGLDKLLDTPVRKLSLGQRMRCDLALALMHNPKIVYLDEPTIGLDLNAKEQMREFIKKINRERRTTVILTTHDMGDIEELCKRVIIIDKGKKIYDGPLEIVRKRFGGTKTITVEFAKAPKKLNVPGAKVISHAGTVAKLKVDTKKVKSAHVVASLLSKYDIHDINVEETSIEDVIKKIYAGGLK